MHAFYVLGISDLQDMLPVMLTSAERKNKVWVVFLDCLLKKRQFYYYTEKELSSFIDEVFDSNQLEKPDISFYGVADKKKFQKDYSIKNPSFVFMQNVSHKSAAWQPTAKNSKVVHFAWHMDSARNITDTKYNVVVNSVKFKKDLAYYGVPNASHIPEWVRVPEHKKNNLEKVNTRYFGNFRTEGLRFKPANFSKFTVPKDKKSCFIIEAHLRKKDTEFNLSTVEMTKELVSLLKSEGYFVIWKKREKGFPKGDWYSPLDVCDVKPDVVIEKDLNFPNTITGLSEASDLTVVMNTSTAVFDAVDVSSKVVILHPDKLSQNEQKKFFDRYKHYGGFAHVKNDWDKLLTILRDNKQSKQYEQTSPSSLLLDYLEENHE